jgi:pimeloyl-ACP methyl ester carboxylesterase
MQIFLLKKIQIKYFKNLKMVENKNILIESRFHDKPIVADVFYKGNTIKKPIVIFCHGYKGYKDWGAWNLVAKTFAQEGCFFLKFNFSHNGGTAEDPLDFPDLEAFSENNYTTELNDLEDVIEWIRSNETHKQELNIDDITLIGHSRAGGIVSIKATENRSVSKVITWNGVSDFGERFPRGKELKSWKQSGVRCVENRRTKQQMPHKYQFYQDFIDNESRLTIQTSIKKLEIAQLIINGSADSVVLSEGGRKMHSWNPSSEWIIIDQMNHTLGSQHPWTKVKLPIHLAKVVEISRNFMKEN